MINNINGGRYYNLQNETLLVGGTYKCRKGPGGEACWPFLDAI